GRDQAVVQGQGRGVPGPQLSVGAATRVGVEVSGLEVSAFEIPTDEPESDGTLEWDSTTLVLVEARGGGEVGLGFTYGDVAVAALVDSKLREVVEGADALAPGAGWDSMRAALRNVGRGGVGAMAI